jgi:hypothetical protein
MVGAFAGLKDCKITNIRRGDTSLSLFVEGAPLGALIYPIRVTLVCPDGSGKFQQFGPPMTFYFFQDEFRDWKGVMKKHE